MTDYHDKQFEFQQEKSLLDIMNYTEFRYWNVQSNNMLYTAWAFIYYHMVTKSNQKFK